MSIMMTVGARVGPLTLSFRAGNISLTTGHHTLQQHYHPRQYQHLWSDTNTIPPLTDVKKVKGKGLGTCDSAAYETRTAALYNLGSGS